MSWENFFKGLVLIAIGLALILKRRVVYGWTGDFDFFAKIFGAHGTITFYVLFGALLVIVGVLFVAGAPSIVENLFQTNTQTSATI